MNGLIHVFLSLHRRLPSVPSRIETWLPRLAGYLRELGPYAAIELLLPGGSLITLLLWLYRRRGSVGPPWGRRRASAQSDAVIVSACTPALQVS
jgi:hypothetical protein